MNILFKTKFGSHLYGTNTPKSDLDYKGIFVAPLDEIILGHSSSVVQDNSKKDKAFGERNEAGDIDIEYKELRQFIKDCLSGQTYALDMLFSPKDLWLNTSPEWEFNGDRARLAMNNKGIDWKAISHAYRCCYQLIELANTHMIHFPLKEAEKLKQIKQGKLVYINIQDELYELMQKAIQAVEESTLPDRAHKEFWDEFIIKVYKNEKI